MNRNISVFCYAMRGAVGGLLYTTQLLIHTSAHNTTDFVLQATNAQGLGTRLQNYPVFMKYFKYAHLKFTVCGRKHTHNFRQCSHASVGLAQAHPNYNRCSELLQHNNNTQETLGVAKSLQLVCGIFLIPCSFCGHNPTCMWMLNGLTVFESQTPTSCVDMLVNEVSRQCKLTLPCHYCK